MLQYGLKLGEKKGDAELGTALAAAGGTFGTVASVGVALLFMIVIYLGYRNGFKRRMKKDKTRRRESDRAIYRAITYTILPIVLSTLVYNISTIIDQGVFNHILAGMGFTQKQYATVWGIYSGKFRVLMNVPLSIASCLAPSVVSGSDRGDGESMIYGKPDFGPAIRSAIPWYLQSRVQSVWRHWQDQS